MSHLQLFSSSAAPLGAAFALIGAAAAQQIADVGVSRIGPVVHRALNAIKAYADREKEREAARRCPKEARLAEYEKLYGSSNIDVTDLDEGRFLIVWNSQQGKERITKYFGQVFDPKGNLSGASVHLANCPKCEAQSEQAVAPVAGGFTFAHTESGRGGERLIHVYTYGADGRRYTHASISVLGAPPNQPLLPSLRSTGRDQFILTWQEGADQRSQIFRIHH